MVWYQLKVYYMILKYYQFFFSYLLRMKVTLFTAHHVQFEASFAAYYSSFNIQYLIQASIGMAQQCNTSPIHINQNNTFH